MSISIFHTFFFPHRSPARAQRGLHPSRCRRLRHALSDRPRSTAAPPARHLAAWAGQARPVASRACSGPATGCSSPALHGPRSSSRQKGHKS